jgi:iron(III) transport system substrate-binding protein
MAESSQAGWRRLAFGAVSAVAMLPLATAALAQAAPAAWDKVVEAAKKEGSATIYSGQGLDQLNEFAARIKKEYGISVTVVRAVENDLWPKVQAEHDTGRGICDLFVSADLGAVKDASAKGYTLAVAGPAFDNPTYDKASRIPEGTYFEADAAILTFSWNTDLYPKGIKDYPDILDPALAGKIGVVNPVHPAMVAFYKYLEENYGPEYVTKLAALKPRIYAGALPLGQAVISGEVAAVIYGAPLIDEKKKGAPVDWGLAKKPFGARFYGQVLKSAPHPNAAQVLANYMVTQSGQEAIARSVAAVLPKVDGAIAATADVPPLDLTKLTPENVRAYQDKWKSLFTDR